MRKINESKFKNNKGITLIALVVTIVVLLILAGISINALIGDNGLIKRAQDAKDKWETAEKSDLESLNNINNFLKENIPDWDGEKTEMPEIKKNETTGKFDWYIYNESQMKFFANYVNETLTEKDKKMITDNNTTIEEIAITKETTIYLMDDLNLGSTFDKDGKVISGKQWIPIGHNNSKPLLGTFEGNNHYICGVYISNKEKFNGIFGNCNSVKNLTIKNSYIEGINVTGGIAGAVRGGIVENCHNFNTTVVLKEGNNNTVGGVVAQCTGEKIEKCTNTGNVISYSTNNYLQMGGICGLSNNTKLIECTNYGNITVKAEQGESYYVGGISGVTMASVEGKSTIERCNNEGKVTGRECVGGIAGSSYIGVTIKNCSNVNEVKGRATLGGIVGMLGNTENKLSYSTLMECYNSGSITAYSENDELRNSFGGIVGFINDKGREDIIEKCYSKGSIINAKEKYGAIIGEEKNQEGKAKLSNLYYLNTVGIGAVNNKDDETKNIKAVQDDLKTYSEFIKWINNL